MNTELERCFEGYLNIAGRALIVLKDAERDGARLRAILEELERTKEFALLAGATGRVFKRSDFDLKVEGKWEMHVQAFLRRSGTYSQLAHGAAAPLPELHKRYRDAFESTTANITYLAPLEFVEFSKESIDFGQFQIRRFDSEELDRLSQNDVRRAFYPWAAIDSSRLEDYWMLTVHETDSSGGEWDQIIMDIRIGISYSDHPPAVQAAMRQLALFNWGYNPFLGPTQVEVRPIRRKDWDGPFVPSIPFVIRLSDSMIYSPGRPPDPAALTTEPIIDGRTGEELGEGPASGLVMNDAETKQFENFLRRTTDLLTAIEPYRARWRFVDTALGFLLKAFTTEGLEQLLWNIAAVEAVVGQKVEAGLTKLLLNRVGNILGGTTEERKDFKRRFGELYAYRSDLVHGNADLTDKNISLGHLGEARDFARCIVLWIVNYLAHVARNIGTGAADVPSREHLIDLIDLDQEGKRQTARILSLLPAEFPNLRDWF